VNKSEKEDADERDDELDCDNNDPHTRENYIAFVRWLGWG
jgi:hypothetical protein